MKKTPAQLRHIIRTWRHVPKSVWKAWERYKHRKRPPAPTAFLTMFDSVTVSEIPKGADAVAGYVGGHWPTFGELVKGWPRAHRLSIAVAHTQAADCADVERGDMTPASALAWFKSHATNVATPKPVLYTSVSLADALIHLFAAAGIPRSSYLLWTAHYTGRPHLCSSACNGAGVTFTHHADATQYTDRALGRNLDASYVRPGFFRGT